MHPTAVPLPWGSMRRATHVIWDWNGTLVDDVDAALVTINRLLQARELPAIDVAHYRSLFDFPIRVYYERLGFDLDDAGFARACSEFLQHYGVLWPRCPLREGAREVLQRLRARGVGQSILSASQRDHLRTQAIHHGLHDAIEHWVGLDGIEAHGKVEEGRSWLADQGIAPDEVVLVGDTLHDLEVARALGVRCLLLAGGHQSEERLRASGNPVCRNLAEVSAAL